jgi:hypothetical protein
MASSYAANPEYGMAVLGFMCQMRPSVRPSVRPSIVHLCDLGVGIVRVRPIVIRALLLSLPIDADQVGARVGVPMPEVFAGVVRNSS